ncbi:FlgD immunoglobulin-like domain containing protein [Rubrivirga sp.]|uniref:FlgD immunoglobulin-like domain containing protein n=1 Tax=Rubrivirga sp. TaxID=1885344 RepID=UPI003C708DDD
MRAFFVGLLLAIAPVLEAQTIETGRGQIRLLPQGALNGVAVLDAEDGVLRAGPVLVEVAPDGTVTIPALEDANVTAFDPPTAVDSRAFTIDAQGDVVVVGLGFNDVTADAEDPPDTAAGFAISTDGGDTFDFRFPALDQSTDTTVAYGASTLPSVPSTLASGSTPVDVALTAGGDTIYSANRLAGLRRSVDGGRTWTRLVLPPDSLLVLDPRETYDFLYSPDRFQPIDFVQVGDQSVPVFPQGAANFEAFSVLVDETGTIWAGTLNGLNRSVEVDGADDPAWVRYVTGPVGSTIPSTWVFALEEQEREGRNHIWAATFVPSNNISFSTVGQQPGVVVWRGDDENGQPIFDTVLLNVIAEDIAFGEDRVYVAAADGLYVSDDDGATWRITRAYRDAEGQTLIDQPVSARAVATTPGRLWVGTNGGLLTSTDGGRTFELFRANVTPSAGDDEGRDVEVYAYPNPFNPRAPGRDGLLRVRLDLEAGADITVRIFDVAMNLIRTLEAPGRPAGPNEVLWDGQSDRGLRVANGAYIYTVDGGSPQASGRILVIQ